MIRSLTGVALLCTSNFTSAFPAVTPLHFPQRTYQAFIADLAAQPPAPITPERLADDIAEADWRALQPAGAISAGTFSYLSGGHRVTGFIVRPTRVSGRRPVVIWARGGVGNVRQGEVQFALMASFARRGFIVVGSNYRGSAGSEGQDEFGGAEVNDLLALAPLIRTIQDADAERWFAIGFSRGGMMLYRAVAEGFPVRAVATAAGVTNIASSAAERPQLAERFRQIMPDYETERANGFCRRSAVCWPERITVPLLIAHGGADLGVSSAQAIELAAAMERARRPYRLLMFGGGDHEFSGLRREFFDAALAFFAEHDRPSRTGR
jgi:dipeptidyl aminopeptidase/acylaminoacyl peptidase